MPEQRELATYVLPFTKLESLQVEVSSICNLECKRCFMHLENHKLSFFPKSLWDEKIHPVLNQIKNISLVGIGEPLLCKDFFYFVEDSIKHNIVVSATSNLQLVNEEIAEEIVTSGVTELSFSCDGGTKETYENIRINGNFEKLLKSLDLINKFKAKYNSPTPRLILNFGALRSNIDEFPQVILLADKYKINAIIAYHFVTYYADLKDDSLFHYQELSDHRFVEAKRRADKLGIKMFLPGLFSRPLKYMPRGAYCPYPFTFLYIYSDGRIGPCCMDFPDRYVLGDINHFTLSQVWNSKEILMLRKALCTAPSNTCRYCVNHLKMDISNPKHFFRFKGSGEYIAGIKERSDRWKEIYGELVPIHREHSIFK